MFKVVGFSLLALGAHATVGDEIPYPPAVINVHIEEPSYGYSDAIRTSTYQENEAKLASLEAMESAQAAGVSNMLRGKSFLAEPQNKLLDPATQNELETKLMKDCGKPCVDFFHQIVEASTKFDSRTGKVNNKWEDTLVSLMQKEYTKVSDLYKDSLETSRLASFVQKRNKMKSRFNPVDSPCADEASCKAVEAVANKCNYARVGAIATYQSLNLAVHVFSVVINVLCGCVHAGNLPTSVCFLNGVAPVCNFPYPVFQGLFKASTQVWNTGVKETTKACNMIGDFRVAAPLP